MILKSCRKLYVIKNNGKYYTIKERWTKSVNGKICNTCKGNGEWVDVESREITICPDCNGTGIISKTCHTLKVNNKMEQTK